MVDLLGGVRNSDDITQCCTYTYAEYTTTLHYRRQTKAGGAGREQEQEQEQEQERETAAPKSGGALDKGIADRKVSC